MKHIVNILFFIQAILLSLNIFSQTFFRSVATGNWNTTATWETSSSLSGPWVAATVTPTNTNSDTIIIRNGHTVSMTANVTVDQVYIEVGGTFQLSIGVLTIANGPGVDVYVAGTLIDATTSNTVFNANARWELAPNATYIKRSGSSAVVWRDNYQGGISTIPANAHWRIQKNGTANPSIVTVGGMHYPNLYIENFTASMYVPAVAGYFQGNTDYPRIKGNFDIGGSGTNFVTFTVDVTNATRITVDGNFIVRSGNILRLWGNGFSIQGNITIDGTVLYDHDHGRMFELTGSSAQTISGTGIFKLWNLRINKSSPTQTVTLNRPLTVDNIVEFVNGRIISSAANRLIFNVFAKHTGLSGNSFVRGPVQKVGNAPFEFPVGKNNTLRPIAILDSTAYVWFEDFGTGCSTGTLANGYSSPNGVWSVVSTGTNEAYANEWYVSAEEQMDATRCGIGCSGANNRTLHLGSTYLGDLGASYFESSTTTCSMLSLCAITNKRVQSPTINLTGYSNITLSFDYIEFGEGTNDNATLWYFDGSSWAILEDLPKTNCCGGVCNGTLQGGFLRYHVQLPASANNNPNVRIGFNWTNNGNGTGTDPSFAVDNILLTADAFTAEFFPSNPKTAFGTTLAPTLDSINSCEYWRLDRNYGNASKTVQLTWGSGSCPMPTLGDLRVARWNGTMWADHGNGGTTGSSASGTIVSSAPISSFSPFTIGYVTTPLPIELGEVDLICNNSQQITVNWTTLSESNTSHFEIQTSNDLLMWETIGRIPAAGWSNTLKPYSVTFIPENGQNTYFRLAQFDLDGKFETFGPWINPCTNLHGIGSLKVFPNPGNQKFSIELDNIPFNKGTLVMMNSVGKIISEQIVLKDDFNNQIITINNLQIPSGVYFILLFDESNNLIFKDKWTCISE